MSEEEIEELEEVLEWNNEKNIRSVISNSQAISIIIKYFKRLSKPSAQKLILLILNGKTNINITEIKNKSFKTFLKYNKNRFDKNKKLKIDNIKELRMILNGFLIVQDSSIKQLDNNTYSINKETTYEAYRKLLCDEQEFANVKYDFDKPDMEIRMPHNTNKLQRCNIQITSRGTIFDFPLEYTYDCLQCGTITKKKVYEVQSTNNRIMCKGIYHYNSPNTGDPKSKICGMNLSPDSELTETKDCYFYSLGYKNIDDKMLSAMSYCFQNVEPGFYEVVLFKIKTPKQTEQFSIVDIKPVETNIYTIPEKIKGENYIITLMKSYDEYIKKQTGIKIWGMNPIKICLILQKIKNMLDGVMDLNISLIGDASTGKSFTLLYYGYLLDNNLMLKTSGLSISVAALRGTKDTILLMGKEHKFITYGHLGSYNSIFIEEIGQDEDLLNNLKEFLQEKEYSYNKAGGTGDMKTRTAHVNVAKNVNNEHYGRYKGGIRKIYDSLGVINEIDKVIWDEAWGLHKPLIEYNDNPYLYKAISEKRKQLIHRGQFWIDGTDLALKQRFFMTFYLVTKKQNDELNKIIKENHAITHFVDSARIIKSLKSDNIRNFFKNLKQYEEGENDFEGNNNVDKILLEYDIKGLDARTKNFYYTVLKMSRIGNQRKYIKEEDYDLVRYIIENIDCELDVVDTNEYEIKGPPNKEEIEKIEKEVEVIEVIEKNKGVDFGIPDGEFNN